MIQNTTVEFILYIPDVENSHPVSRYIAVAIPGGGKTRNSMVFQAGARLWGGDFN